MLRTITPFRVFLLLLAYLLLNSAPPCQASLENTYVAFYWGQYSDTTFLDAVSLKSDFKDSRIAVFAAGKRFQPYKNLFRFETEFQIAEHRGLKYFSDPDPASSNPGCCWAEGYSYEIQNTGHHSHQEFNLVLVFRWLKFPWDHIIDTSIAVGEGISYATREPAVEVDPHYLYHGLEYPISQWLNYLSVEYAFRLPQKMPAWSLFLRVHHRSGIYGLINDYHGGSDFLTMGLRYDY